MNITSTQQNLDNWFHSPLGRSLLASEQQELNYILAEFSGEYLVKLGGHSFEWQKFLSKSPIKQKIYLTSTITTDAAQVTPNEYNITDVVKCNYGALPLACDSIDAIIIHHTLEFAANPRIILEEIYQALAPRGHLVVIGFNPYNLWGIKRFFAKKNTLAGRFISPSRIQHWLKQLNFTVNKYDSFYFRPPRDNAETPSKLHFLDELGKLLHLKYGAYYIFVAEKKFIGVTPIKSKAKALSEHLSFGYLKPSLRPSPQTNRSKA